MLGFIRLEELLCAPIGFFRCLIAFDMCVYLCHLEVRVTVSEHLETKKWKEPEVSDKQGRNQNSPALKRFSQD